MRNARAVTALALLAGLPAGCGSLGELLGTGDSPRTTLNLSTLGAGDDSTHYESFNNDLLETAEPAPVGAEPKIIRGTISGSSDADVYDLGPLSIGTRIVVEMTAEETLNPALALFDENGASLLVNDHRNAYMGRKEPFIDVVLRRDSDNCFLAVAATPHYLAEGEYGLVITVTESQPIPVPRPDDVILVFSGGSQVRIGGRAPVDVPRFDSVTIDQRFAGATATIEQLVVAMVREDYAEHDVQIFSTSEGATPDGFMTRLYFGTYDPGLLGVAEGVDEYNSTGAQKAIVFTDTFAAFAQIDPSVDEIAQALANVASHEIGHLLGLVHTRDQHGIMDVTASLNQLMEDQQFRFSPLYDDVFPVGFQNSGQSLLDAVGGTFDLEPFMGAGLPAEYTPMSKTYDDGRPPARNIMMFSSCGLDH